MLTQLLKECTDQPTFNFLHVNHSHHLIFKISAGVYLSVYLWQKLRNLHLILNWHETIFLGQCKRFSLKVCFCPYVLNIKMKTLLRQFWYYANASFFDFQNFQQIFWHRLLLSSKLQTWLEFRCRTRNTYATQNHHKMWSLGHNPKETIYCINKTFAVSVPFLRNETEIFWHLLTIWFTPILWRK